jgi:Ca2+/Na+ antiporter
VLYSPQVISAFLISSHGWQKSALALISGYVALIFGIVLPLLYFFKPYFVDREYLKLEIPAVILALLLYYVLSINKVYGPISAFIFLGFFINFKVALYFKKRNSKETQEINCIKNQRCLLCFFTGFFGALIIFAGSLSLVYSFKLVALTGRFLLYPLYFYFFPVVLSVSVLAAVIIRLKNGEAIFNITEKLFHSVIYSFIFSLGLLSAVKTIKIPHEALSTYNYVTIAFPLVFLALLLPNLRLSKIKAGILIGGYITVTVLSFLKII